ncbi:MAG: hypothetical protein ACRCX8_19950 [Sarcina sp.]
MRVINSISPEFQYEDINKYLIGLNESYGFIHVLTGKHQPRQFENFASSSILQFKSKFHLDFLENNSFEKYNQYIRLLNNFIEYNEVSIYSIRSEVISSFIATLDKDTTDKILKQYSEQGVVDLFNSSIFIKDVYEKSKVNNTIGKVFDFLLERVENCPVQKIKNQVKLISETNDIGKLIKSIGAGMILANEVSESEKGFSVDLENMSSDEKVEWLKKYSADTNLMVIDIVGSGSSLMGVDYNSLFNPEFTVLDRLSEKYKNFVGSVKLNEQNCSLYKSLVYLAVYLGKDSVDCPPTEYMKRLINRDTRWAVGTEVTHDPSFYGDSDLWKMLYGYGSFMTGNRNPFQEIIDNKQVDDMDRQSLLMHQWFNENGLSEVIYNMIYEKGVVGDNSIYDVLSMVKELIQLLEDPIVASSGLDNLTSSIKGIVSGMINSFVTTIDFSISGVARKLFYTKFIPTSKGNISIGEFHDYVAFISAILKQYEDGAPTSAIDRNSFVNQIYSSLSGDASGFEKVGYGAFDNKINDKVGVSLYEEHLHKISDGNTFYLSKHIKTIHALIIFAVQKKLSKYGNSYDTVISYGDQSSIKSIISSLTDDEIFYVFKTFGINFTRFNDNFEYYNIKELIDFNNELKDAQLYTDLDPYSGGFYNSYLNYDKAILALEMNQEFFKLANYKKYINKSISYYFGAVNKNKKNLAKAILDKNNVSDIDDFLMRYLHSFEELARTLGFNTGTIEKLIYILDYICEFITSILFKKLYLDIKGYINDYVKSITDDIFTVIDSVGESLGGSNSVVIKFEIGGKFITGKLESLMKMLDDFTLTSKFLDQCFMDPDLRTVNLDDYLDGNYTGDDFDIDVGITDGGNSNNGGDNNGSNGGGGSGGGNNGNIVKPPIDDGLDITITVVDKDFVEKVIEAVIDKKEPPKYITYEKGDITITTENGNKIVIVSKDDSRDGGFSVTQETYDKIESEIISKEQIDQLIEIRDFITNITNRIIIDLQNQLNSVKKDIEEELNKTKPDNGKLTDLTEKEKELIKEIENVKKQTGINTSNIKGTVYENKEQEDVVLHNFSNGDLNLDRLTAILDDLNDFSKTSKIPLTTSQIMELLK